MTRLMVIFMNRPIELYGLQLSQLKGKPVFVSKMKLSDLIKVTTVSFRRASEDNLYQRNINRVNIGKIKNYVLSANISKDPLILFPTPILLGADIPITELPEGTDVNGLLNKSEELELPDGEILLLPIVKNASLYRIFLPQFGDKYIFLVDGQHRYVALKELYEIKAIEDFELPIVLLAEYDKFNQAEVFANINFNQKPVNKSLYYDIFGSLPSGNTDLKLAHFLARNLNEREESPLYRMIKMLGTGEGVVSQAFFVETVLEIFNNSRPNGLKSMLNFYKENDQLYTAALPILMNYFRFIKESFSEYWPTPIDNKYSSYHYKDILLKTSGIFSLLNLFSDAFIVPEHLHWKDYQKLKLDFAPMLKILKSPVQISGYQNYAEYFFSRRGKFAGVGSRSVQTLLYRELITRLKDENFTLLSGRKL